MTQSRLDLAVAFAMKGTGRKHARITVVSVSSDIAPMGPRLPGGVSDGGV